jgi:hypothetical protein
VLDEFIFSMVGCMGRISHTNLKNRMVISGVATSKNHIQGGYATRWGTFVQLLFTTFLRRSSIHRILRFTGPTTHLWKQEKIPQGASELDFGFRA